MQFADQVIDFGNEASLGLRNAKRRRPLKTTGVAKTNSTDDQAAAFTGSAG